MEVLKHLEILLKEQKIKEAEKFLKEKLKSFLNLTFKERLTFTKMRKKGSHFSLNNISSVLVVSCHNIKHMKKVLKSEASLILFNLEDGVKEEYKDLARLILMYFLLNFDINKPYLIRINKGENFLEDLYQVLSLNPMGIRIPKTNLEDIYLFSNLIEKYLNKDDFLLGISIETKESVKNINLLLKIVKEKFKNVLAFIGIYDLKAEMPFLEKDFFKNLKTTLAIKLNIFDIYPIGAAYQNYKDLEGFMKEALEEKALGFKAKFCLGPAQVKIANKIFSKDKNLLLWAKDIVEKFEKNGPYYEDGMFIDEPIYKEAKNILESF